MQKPYFKAKNLWKCIFRASRRLSFSCFPKVALNHGVIPFPPAPIAFRIFVDHVTIFKPDATSKMELFLTNRL